MINKILNYLKTTPYNYNENVFKPMLEELVEETESSKTDLYIVSFEASLQDIKDYLDAGSTGGISSEITITNEATNESVEMSKEEIISAIEEDGAVFYMQSGEQNNLILATTRFARDTSSSITRDLLGDVIIVDTSDDTPVCIKVLVSLSDDGAGIYPYLLS